MFLSSAVTLAVLGSGIVASTSIGVSTASAAELASKSAFCGGNITIDKASASVDSNAGFLKVLKEHKSALSTMEKNLPSGTVGTEARDEIGAAQAAIASGNVSDLNNVPSSAGGDIDTYCGVDGNGQALPSYFGKGKATAFCSTFLPVYEAVSNAPTAAARTAAFTAHQTQINQLASELSTLPKSIKAKATAAVTKAQAAIKSNNSALATSGSGSGAASYVALYCGQNQ
jgi:Tfp pilus assembly protein FimV